MEPVHILRIIVASPGDVQAERDALPAVLEGLNRGIAAAHGLRLELRRWETDAYPGFHPQGPQGLIDPILRSEDCDVLLGICWKRFGTPTQDAGSGMEHEFLRAYAAWQQHGEADQRRAQVKITVEQFAAAFPKVRVLVTSRTYAYQRQDWKLRGFAEAVLAPFDEAQMHRLVDRWYAYVGPARRLSADDTQGRATLLLTLMASLHAWRGGTLPEQREALYADAVDVLLDQWEGQKLRRSLAQHSVPRKLTHVE